MAGATEPGTRGKMDDVDRKSAGLPRGPRTVISIGLLLLVPIALLLRAYGGAAAMVAVSGWVLSDEHSMTRMLVSSRPREVFAKILVTAGAVSFLATLAYLLGLTIREG